MPGIDFIGGRELGVEVYLSVLSGEPGLSIHESREDESSP